MLLAIQLKENLIVKTKGVFGSSVKKKTNV